MEMRRARYAIVSVILLCVSAIGSVQGMRTTVEMVFGNGGPEINEDMAEQAWIHCWKELTDRKDSFEDFDLYVPWEASSELKSALLTRRKMHKAISILPPQLKQELLDCVRKKNLHYGLSAQGVSSRYWIIKCFELLFHWPNAPRRYLASKSYQQIAPSAGPSLAPSPAAASPGSGPAPASSPSLNSLPFPLFQQQKIHHQKVTSDSPQLSSPRVAHRYSPPNSPAFTRHPLQSQNQIQRETFVAIVTTAAVTFCFVALVFCCWCCCRFSNNKIGSGYGQRDERPLLRLSDFSASSSQNSSSLGLGSSSKKEHSSHSGKINSFKARLSMKVGRHESSLAEVTLSEAKPGEALPHLKPPPGRPVPPPPPPPAARPPPPPKVSRPPPAPPSKANIGPHHRGHSNSSVGDDFDGESGAPKAKLKPFFWDKVMASPGHSMVWHEISAGSFQFNEEMIESLFGYNAVDNKNDRKRDPSEPSFQYIRIIDTRKAQNLSILLRALNVTTEEVIDALREGNELPVELIQTLLKMALTSEEELKLRLFTGDIGQLGPAERFLKILVEIPFAFKRLESLLFMSSLQEEVSTLKESFAILEVACNKLRNNRLFLKLLEAVLKTGNRMNDGTYRGGAQAFRLDTLLKLSDVKGTDGKTTLLHFVVQEIIRSEGIRAVRTARASRSISSVKSEDFIEDSNQAASDHYRSLGLQVVSSLSIELADVKKAAILDADVLTSSVSNLKQSLIKTKTFVDSDMKNLEEDSEFYHAVSSFVDRAESDIKWLSQEEKRIMALVKSTADYFHGHAGRDEGLRLFTIVRDFLIILDKVCKEVRDDRAAKPMRNSKKESSVMSDSPEKRQQSIQRQQPFPPPARMPIDSSSSDDDSSSP